MSDKRDCCVFIVFVAINVERPHFTLHLQFLNAAQNGRADDLVRLLNDSAAIDFKNQVHFGLFCVLSSLVVSACTTSETNSHGSNGARFSSSFTNAVHLLVAMSDDCISTDSKLTVLFLSPIENKMRINARKEAPH